jgi:hypothetical protein
MDHPSRDEMEARLEAIQARSDARVAALQASMDTFIARMNERTMRESERFAHVDLRLEQLDEHLGLTNEHLTQMNGHFTRTDIHLARLDEHLARTDEHLTRLEGIIAEMREQLRSLKVTIIVTALSTTIAVILGVGTLNAALHSNMIAAFESGKDIAAAQSELKRQSEETAGLLREMHRRLDLQAPAGR